MPKNGESNIVTEQRHLANVLGSLNFDLSRSILTHIPCAVSSGMDADFPRRYDYSRLNKIPSQKAPPFKRKRFLQHEL